MISSFHFYHDIRRLNYKSGLRFFLFIFNPKVYSVLIFRLASYFYSLKYFRFISHFLTIFNQIIWGIEISPKCQIGKGLLLPHTIGTVIGAYSIGDNVTIFQGVTLGAKFTDFNFCNSTRPVIGNNVVLGSGSKVLGAIRVGDNSVIAANSLVTKDIPDNSFAIGVPALVRPIKDV